MYAIEKDIPLAPRSFNGGRRCTTDKRVKYPFRLMDVGDSFAVPAAQIKTRRATQRRLSVLATQYGKKLHAKFATRALPKLVRVWRVA